MKSLHVMNGIRKEEKTTDAEQLHRVIEEYGQRRPMYQEFAEVIRFISQEELHSKSIRVHSIKVRAKAIDSFRRKVSQRFAVLINKTTCKTACHAGRRRSNLSCDDGNKPGDHRTGSVP